VPKLPALRDAESSGKSLATRATFAEEDGEFRLRHIVAVLLHNKWLILGCMALTLAIAAAYVRVTRPIYEASATIRIDENSPNLPAVFQMLPQGGQVSTEMEVIASRRLIEDATRQLGLQVRIDRPFGVSRQDVIDQVRVAEDAPSREVLLLRRPDGRVMAKDGETGEIIGMARVGERLEMPGAGFRLLPGVSRYETIEIAIKRFRSAVAGVSQGVTVVRAAKEADIVSLGYRDPDAGLVWQVPNAITQHFIERRQELQKTVARSQVTFLRAQLDTLSKQLGASEEELKEFRERAQVVSPMVEAQSRIERLVNLEAQRSTLDAERGALAELLVKVDRERAAQAEGGPSPYRQLLAFPSLLRSEAASQLLRSLISVEDQRSALLARRTMTDQDVQLLTGRIEELEGQLATIARTYLSGLTSQVGSLDATLGRYGAELRSMPQKELEYGRLERRPAVLKDIYALLQTRLKEAEIAQAVEDASVTVVDEAIQPRVPVSPKKHLAYLVGLFGGLLLGVTVAVGRELMDLSVRTRADVTTATGLPVLALIPRIGPRGRQSAMIAVRSVSSIRKATQVSKRPILPPPGSLTRQPPPAAHPDAGPRRMYTFLGSVGDEEAAQSSPENLEQGAVPQPHASAPAPTTAKGPDPQVRLTLSELGGAMAEAYSILQTNLAFARVDDPVKTLVLTSALPGEGKTTTAANLAIALTERGLNVLLIDADLRRGRVHQLFGLPREPGLSDVLQGRCHPDAARQVMALESGRCVSFLTCGAVDNSPPALVGSVRMRDLLHEVRDLFDLVIVDSPPVNILTDAALLGTHADGVVLVARAGSTDASALTYAVEQLANVRAPLLGVVLNDIDLKRHGAYDGAYRYVDYKAYLGTPAGDG
jgi:capsular exopolysaccharide synthesis family protein